MDSLLVYYEKCRLCLDDAGHNNIFEDDAFPEEIFLCTALRVHPNDYLPQKVCWKCYDIVKNAKKLREVVECNNEHLRILLAKVPPFLEKKPILPRSNRKAEKRVVGRQRANLCGSTLTAPELSDDPPIAVPRSRRHCNVPVTRNDTKICRNIAMSENKGLYECLICFKTFKSFSRLLRHRIIHEKTFPCTAPACHMQFATKTELKNHVLTHLAQKLYTCNICATSFASRPTLATHNKNMHGKTIACTWPSCTKQFLNKKDMQKHCLTHKNSQRYACDGCPKKNNQQKTLKTHKHVK